MNTKPFFLAAGLVLAGGIGRQVMAQDQQTGRVIIQVQGIKADKCGELSAGIFNEANFPNQGKQIQEIRKPIAGGTMTMTFEKVAPGTYGIATYQDVDKNKELNTNFIGLPKELVGFSNDARIKMGPPAWADAAFKVEAGKTTTLTIPLR